MGGAPAVTLRAVPPTSPPVVLDPALVIGLGNPGAEYAGNRHNVGAMVLDELATRCGASLRRHKARAMVADARLGVRAGGAPGPRVILARPTTYMNESGAATAALASFYAIPAGAVVVVHDELELSFGEIRVKRGGGEGGHNGLRSISSALRTRDYLRVRVGIGRPPGRQTPADFVLRDFGAAERKELPFVLSDAADQVEVCLAEGESKPGL